MNISQLINLLQNALEANGDVPVTMGWSENGRPGPVVAMDIHLDGRVELRCERIED